MNREEAIIFLEKNLRIENLVKHSLAVESGMRSLARYFNQDVERWGLAGLLHDIDYELTKDSPDKHSLLGADILLDQGLDSEIVMAVKSHNEIHGLEPESLMARALFCVDPLTGLIIASTLVLPEKSLKGLTVESVLKRFNEKAFARGANREIIGKCQEYLDLSLEKFVEIVLPGMQEISSELGLDN
jgi:uncharacterized protein